MFVTFKQQVQQVTVNENVTCLYNVDNCSLIFPNLFGNDRNLFKKTSISFEPLVISNQIRLLTEHTN